jgi:hypothetical protein
LHRVAPWLSEYSTGVLGMVVEMGRVLDGHWCCWSSRTQTRGASGASGDAGKKLVAFPFKF